MTGCLVEDKKLEKFLREGFLDNLYVPNGAVVGSEKYHYKLRWLKLLRVYLKLLLKNQSGNLNSCGDFNIALEDQDIHDPKGQENHIMASELERQALREILELGFADAFRKFPSEGEHFSWWGYRNGSFRRNQGWQIDCLYPTSTLYKRIACTIDSTLRQLPKPSDHAPIVVEL